MGRALTFSAVCLAVLLLVAGCGLASATPQQDQPLRDGDTTTSATVVAVVDGDTVKLDDGRTIRVLGIDTPETRHPSKPVECFGPEATAFATEVLLNARVRVAEDPTQDATDRYGRTLAYLLLPDGQNYSVAAVQVGVARSYVYDDRPVTEYPAILAAELTAQARGTGLWGACPR